MDRPHPVRPPVVLPREAAQVEAELSAAIALVAADGARRVLVSGVPDLDTIAATALAWAQAAGVRFALARDPSSGALYAVVGRREA